MGSSSRDHKRRRAAATGDDSSGLAGAHSPAALRGVADTHATVDGVAELSLLTAGDILLQPARSGLRPGLAAGDEGAELTPEDKASSLQEADAFFAGRQVAVVLDDPAQVGQRLSAKVAAVLAHDGDRNPETPSPVEVLRVCRHHDP